MPKPILTVRVSLTETRDLQLKVQRHSLDPVELLAAGGFVAETIFQVAGQLSRTARVEEARSLE